jgi:hypothetical protein
MRVDVHQHLWPEQLLVALRERQCPPRLLGWTLQLAGEPDYPVSPAQHDVRIRAEQTAADGIDLALVSLSSPLGIEWLPPEEAAPMLKAYHEGAAQFPAPLGAWAAAGLLEVDPAGLAAELDRGFVGLQLPATALLDRAGYDRCRPLLALLAERDRPLFIHPGAAAPANQAPDVPAWWPALVPYVQQMHAAWFAFRAYGRAAHPRLRVCFAMLAGLGPLHSERFSARGGTITSVDPLSYVETSSYGTQAVDATLRVLGVDVIVHGSDRPYATPADPRLDPAARHALRSANPARLLALPQQANPAARSSIGSSVRK